MPVTELTTEEEFKNAINREDDQLVVVDFSAIWCGPCKRMAEPFSQMSDEFESSHFYKLDVDQVAEIAQELKVFAIPAFKLFRQGKEVAEMMGADEAKLRELIGDHQPAPEATAAPEENQSSKKAEESEVKPEISEEIEKEDSKVGEETENK